MKEALNNAYDFLAAHDFPTLLKTIHEIGWGQLAKNPYTWLIIVPLMTYLLWTKKYKMITALVSVCLFLLLAQRTLSPVGETLPLKDMLTFLGGTAGLIGVNIYLLFIKQ